MKRGRRLPYEYVNVHVSKFIGARCEEQETAREVGMTAAQAVWYLKDGTSQPAKRKPEFIQLETPMCVVEYLEKSR